MALSFAGVSLWRLGSLRFEVPSADSGDLL
jgi:hypothetical protein